MSCSKSVLTEIFFNFLIASWRLSLLISALTSFKLLLKSSALDKWLDKNIEYVGEASNVRDLIRKSKMVVLPSYYGEGLPKILIEAAACGKPVITTNHPGCRDAILPNITGLLIPIKSSKELSIAINKLFDSPKLYKSMSKEARKFAIRKFDLKIVIKRHMQIYREILC